MTFAELRAAGLAWIAEHYDGSKDDPGDPFELADRFITDDREYWRMLADLLNADEANPDPYLGHAFGMVVGSEDFKAEGDDPWLNPIHAKRLVVFYLVNMIDGWWDNAYAMTPEYWDIALGEDNDLA